MYFLYNEMIFFFLLKIKMYMLVDKVVYPLIHWMEQKYSTSIFFNYEQPFN